MGVCNPRVYSRRLRQGEFQRAKGVAFHAFHDAIIHGPQGGLDRLLLGQSP